MSAVVVGELLYGFQHGSRRDHNRRQLRDFLGEAYVDFVPVTMDTCERFAVVAAQLRRSGTPIPSNDIWVAAHALETGAHILSYDSHFADVAGILLMQP
jgi:predicted nucleic acid-binding protein